MKIDTYSYHIFQTQISTNDWPSDGYWPKLLEAYKFTYYNWTFDYDEYINYVMNENNTDTSQQGVDLMRSYVKNNYVKVSKPGIYSVQNILNRLGLMMVLMHPPICYFRSTYFCDQWILIVSKKSRNMNSRDFLLN